MGTNTAADVVSAIAGAVRKVATLDEEEKEERLGSEADGGGVGEACDMGGDRTARRENS